MEKIIKIETTGTNLIGFTGFVKEKDAEKTLRTLKNNYIYLRDIYGDTGRLIVNTSIYNPELPYRF